MKKLTFYIIFVINLLVSSCNDTKSKHTIYWQDNNLCVVMPHPTMGIVVPGQVDWRGVDLDTVIEDIYTKSINSKKNGDIMVWVRFEIPRTDKYGNESMSYDDYMIATIPISEARKFKSAKYLDYEYHLKENIQKGAFGNVPPFNY